MSTLTKVFIVLVFVVALVMLGITVTLFAQRIDWKDKFVKEVNHHYSTINAKNADIAAREVEVKNQEGFIANLNNKIDILDVENSAKAEKIAGLVKDIGDRQAMYDKLEADFTVLVRQLEVQMAEIKETTTRVDEMRAKVAKYLAESYTARAELQYARQQAEVLQKDLAELEVKHVDTARHKRDLEERIQALQLKGINTETFSRRALEGKVMSAAPDLGLVVISVTKNDGVLEGDEYTVYRGGEFVAKIRIERTDAKWSSGVVVFKKSDPRKGDDVSNTIAGTAPKQGGGQ